MKIIALSKSIFLFNVIVLVGVSKLMAQNDSLALEKADTSHFSVNEIQDWQLFNSYVSPYNSDSVQLELILQHTNNINWVEDQYVGTIKYNTLLPDTSQSLAFNLLNDIYLLRVEATGECFLRLVSSALPTDDPVVIPLKIYYKRELN